MEGEERTVEGAVDVFLERLDRLVAQGLPLAEAKTIAMTIAVCWLDPMADWPRREAQIREALTRRSAPVIIDAG